MTKKAAAKKAAPAKKAPAKAAPTKAAGQEGRRAKTPSSRPGQARPRRRPAKKKLSAAELKFLESQHELLLKERATYLRQADSLKAEADSLAELREPGDVQFDEESGEGDTLAVERERDLALSHQARAAVEEIDHALDQDRRSAPTASARSPGSPSRRSGSRPSRGPASGSSTRSGASADAELADA